MDDDSIAGSVYRFAEIAWHEPMADGTSGLIEGEVGRDAYGRKKMAQGDGGFFVQIVKMPPGFVAPMHSHDHPEVFMVLEGDCSFGAEHLGRYDMTVVAAGQPYGFEAGDDGVQFLVVRPGKAGFAATS